MGRNRCLQWAYRTVPLPFRTLRWLLPAKTSFRAGKRLRRFWGAMSAQPNAGKSSAVFPCAASRARAGPMYMRWFPSWQRGWRLTLSSIWPRAQTPRNSRSRRPSPAGAILRTMLPRPARRFIPRSRSPARRCRLCPPRRFRGARPVLCWCWRCSPLRPSRRPASTSSIAPASRRRRTASVIRRAWPAPTSFTCRACTCMKSATRPRSKTRATPSRPPWPRIQAMRPPTPAWPIPT